MKDLINLLLESNPHRVMFSMIIIVIVATAVILLVERKLKKSEKTDYERLFELARYLNCSEFDIFQKAAENWNIPLPRVKEDFKKYLLYSEIPHYVRNFISVAKGKHERG